MWLKTSGLSSPGGRSQRRKDAEADFRLSSHMQVLEEDGGGGPRATTTNHTNIQAESRGRDERHRRIRCRLPKNKADRRS